MSPRSCKTRLLFIINGLLMLLSIAIIVIYSSRFGSRTERCIPEALVFESVMIGAGSSLLVASVMSLFYCCCLSTSFRKSAFCFYTFCMVVSIILGIIISIYALSESHKGSGTELPGKAYKEYKLGNYSGLIKGLVKDPDNWNRTKTCMIKTNICTNFANKYLNDTVEKFQKERLTSVESGCCKPPNDCGFTYRSPSNWSEENGMYKNPDCGAWDNDPKVLCFNCESCKAGVADKMKHPLSRFAVVALLLVFAAIFLFGIAWFAFSNTGDHDGGFNLA